MRDIKIGDTVDCSGWIHGQETCIAGNVTRGPDKDGDYSVDGDWSDGHPWHCVRPDQITRHVPAAPVVERPKSCGDKLASEMTVREDFIKAGFQGLMADPTCTNINEEMLFAAVDRLIAALDKERTT